jgi:hypothetical protein
VAGQVGNGRCSEESGVTGQGADLIQQCLPRV